MLFDFMQVNNKYTSPASKNVGEIFKTNVSECIPWGNI